MRDLKNLSLLDKVNILIKFLYMNEKHYVIYENYEDNFIKITMDENFNLKIIDLEYDYRYVELENKFSVSDYIDVINYLEKNDEYKIVTDVVIKRKIFKESKRMKNVVKKLYIIIFKKGI